MEGYRHIRHWVDDLPKTGRSSFAISDAEAQFPDMSKAAMRNALHRLSVVGKIRSIWRGFYAIVLPEYGISGDVPPIEYIDQLMAYAKSGYYVALLSASALQGASHQSPQVFQVMCNKQLRGKDVSGSRLEFSYKSGIPQGAIEKKVVKSGYISVSMPALTALDLVAYPSRSGGISNVVSVLVDLASSIDFSILDEAALNSVRRAAVQRLGHLLGHEIGETELADSLYEMCAQAGLAFSRVDLVPGHPEDRHGVYSRWKVAVNYDVEVEN
jgi:predicted transcriptional regulator of viral defense system